MESVCPLTFSYDPSTYSSRESYESSEYHPILSNFPKSTLILSSRLRLGSLSCHFSSGFPTQIPHAFLISPCQIWSIFLFNSFQRIRSSRRSYETFRIRLVLWWRVVSPTLNPKLGEQPLVSYLRLLIPYIRSYTLHLETVSSIRNPRTRDAVVTRDPLNMDIPYINIPNVSFVKLIPVTLGCSSGHWRPQSCHWFSILNENAISTARGRLCFSCVTLHQFWGHWKSFLR
jgi:hypothetical protein